MDDPLNLTPWHRLALAYAPPSLRKQQEAVFAMDAICAKICDSTTETLIGQMRYAWWRDVMNGTSSDRRSGHPLLLLLQDIGLNRAQLIPVIDAWEGYVAGGDDTSGIDHAHMRADALSALWAHITSSDHALSAGAFFSSYTLWDDIRSGRHDDNAPAARTALHHQAEALRQWKMPKSCRVLAVIRSMILRDVLHDRWDRPILRPSMAARIIFHGLTG